MRAQYLYGGKWLSAGVVLADIRNVAQRILDTATDEQHIAAARYAKAHTVAVAARPEISSRLNDIAAGLGLI